MENTNKFKWRQFISMSIFNFVIILVVTGTAIQITEDISENYETVEYIPPYLTSILHSVTAIHILVGFSFGILSIVHIILNWKSLKNYFGKKTSRINKEAIFAFSLSIFFIVIGIIIALTIF
jgi:cytochrome b561